MRVLWQFAIGLFFSSLILLGMVLLVEASPLYQSAADGQVIFQQKCAGCHSIGGGKLVGPDLQDVTKRQDLGWLNKFISAPDEMFASGDAIAVKLLAEYNDIKMPNLGLSATEVGALIAYLENPGAVSQPAQNISQANLGNPERGRKLYTGQVPLVNGGIPCSACHNVIGSTTLGGGSLGPDLTHVFQRYGGATGMAGTLAGLPFPTMQGIFSKRPLTSEEQADLLAFFKRADKQSATPVIPNILWLIATGILGTVILFGVMAFYWPRLKGSISERLRSKIP